MQSSTDAEYELRDARSEIERHHRDFERIGALCDRAVNHFFADGTAAALNALREIRDIVG